MLPRDKKKFIFNPILISLCLLLVLVFLSWPLAGSYLKKRKIDLEVAELRVEIERLEGGNSELKKLLSYLNSDQFAEAQARLNFGLKKPGEEVVVVKSNDSLQGIIGSIDGEEKISNPSKWLKYFLKLK